MPFEGFNCGGASSLLVAVATDGTNVKTILLICWEFKRGLRLGNIQLSLSDTSEMGNGSALSESLALPSAGFDPTLGVRAISVRLVWDGLGVVQFETSVSLGLEREGVPIGVEGVILVWLSSLYDLDSARCIKNSLDCCAAAVKAFEFLFELGSGVSNT